VRSYLFLDAEAITEDDLTLRLLVGDAGVAARPFLALPCLEFRLGVQDMFDLRVEQNNRVLGYGAVRVVF
jgi:hypothetical protein